MTRTKPKRRPRAKVPTMADFDKAMSEGARRPKAPKYHVVLSSPGVTCYLVPGGVGQGPGTTFEVAERFETGDLSRAVEAGRAFINHSCSRGWSYTVRDQHDVVVTSEKAKQPSDSEIPMRGPYADFDSGLPPVGTGPMLVVELHQGRAGFKPAAHWLMKAAWGLGTTDYKSSAAKFRTRGEAVEAFKKFSDVWHNKSWGARIVLADQDTIAAPEPAELPEGHAWRIEANGPVDARTGRAVIDLEKDLHQAGVDSMKILEHAEKFRKLPPKDRELVIGFFQAEAENSEEQARRRPLAKDVGNHLSEALAFNQAALLLKASLRGEPVRPNEPEDLVQWAWKQAFPSSRHRVPEWFRRVVTKLESELKRLK